MILRSSLIQDSTTRAVHAKLPLEDLERRGREEGVREATEAQRRARLRALQETAGDPALARATLERIVGGNDLSPVNYLEVGFRCARSVCRVHLRDSLGATVGYGTGFLVAPGVLMTNHHVISSADEARGSLAEFDYELDAGGSDKPVIRFELLADPAPVVHRELDFALVGVAPAPLGGGRRLDEFGWLPLDGTPGKAFVGEYLTVIQHPGGERKQVCVRENKLLRYDEGQVGIWYQTDTVGGSSGSPVFNQSWQVVALHHSGVPRTDAKGRWLTVDGTPWDASMDESRIDWIANEGIRISAIVRYLESLRSQGTIVRNVLRVSSRRGGRGPLPLSERRTGSSGDGTISEFRDGELQVTVPVRIAVRVGGAAPGPRGPSGEDREPDGGRGTDAAPTAAGGRSGAPAPSAIEAVRVDQSDYGKRPGYDPEFLGKGGLRVPLPLPVANAKAKPAILKFRDRGKMTHELRYWNYSVVLHKDRRLAVVAAGNVDADLRPEGAGRDGDRWYHDSRIAEDAELGSEFYGQQREFEADRSANPFDRGHLVRRLDAQWGDGAAAAKRNGDDSFHWTNCSPQHWRFNQGAKRWLGLEDWVIERFAAPERRACALNGPVFDAPLSRTGPSGRPVPDIRGKRHADPTFGDVAIPKMFFKVVAARRNGDLVAAAFVMSQEDFLVETDRLRGLEAEAKKRRRALGLSDAEARLYQVSVKDVETLTGLSFGTLAAADTLAQEAAIGVQPRPILELGDIRLR